MHRGMTLIEMTMTMVILAIVASVVLPLMGDDSHGRIGAATILLRNDLEQARFRTVADPGNPLAFRIDEDQKGWKLIDPLDPSRTITRDDGSSWAIRSGEGRGVGMLGVEFELDGIAQSTLEFDESGAILDRSAAPIITITCQQRTRTLKIGAVTGIIHLQDDQ